MNILKKTVYLTALICMQSVAYASDIDLTELSNGSETSHNHIFENKYNDDSHWEECKICKTISNKVSHKKTTAYTRGSSCASNNIKIVKCSGCSYYTESPAGYSHTYSSIMIGCAYGDLDIYKVCSDCLGAWYRWSEGNKYYVSGKEVTPQTVKLGDTISGGGNSHRITNIQRVWDRDCDNWDTDVQLDGTKCNITAVFTLPEYMHSWSQSEVSGLDYQIWINGLNKSSLTNGTTRISIGSKTVNMTNKTITLKSSFTVDNINANREFLGLVASSVTLTIQETGGTHSEKYSKNEYVPLNVTDPTITDASY